MDTGEPYHIPYPKWNKKIIQVVMFRVQVCSYKFAVSVFADCPLEYLLPPLWEEHESESNIHGGRWSWEERRSLPAEPVFVVFQRRAARTHRLWCHTGQSPCPLSSPRPLSPFCCFGFRCREGLIVHVQRFLQLIGWTPLVEIKRIVSKDGVDARIVGKVEAYQPLCSVKDRSALRSDLFLRSWFNWLGELWLRHPLDDDAPQLFLSIPLNEKRAKARSRKKNWLGEWRWNSEQFQLPDRFWIIWLNF
jgi:hypothetical protein